MNRAEPSASSLSAGALRELEADGLVIRREYLEVPVRVEYEIAPRCRSLIPILDDLGRWCDSLPHGDHGEGSFKTLEKF